jgi:hypothetical protein
MEVPHNFILILLAVGVGVLRHWFPEMENLLVILLVMINPAAQMLPGRAGVQIALGSDKPNPTN